MTESTHKNQNFFTVSGVIDELGNITFLPSLQTTSRPNTRKPTKKSSYAVRLLYKDEIVIERSVSTSEVQACGPTRQKGLDYLAFWVSLPLVQPFDLIQLFRKKQLIFEKTTSSIAKVTDIQSELVKGQLNISWKAPNQELLYSVGLKFDNEKYIPLTADQDKTTAIADMAGHPHGAKVKVFISATDGFLTSTTESPFIEIKPTTPLAVILSPRDNTTYTDMEHISLIANCYDAFGEQLDWEENDFAWYVDNSPCSTNKRIGILHGLKSGKHTVEVISKKWGVLASSSIQIEPPPKNVERYNALFARLLPK